MAKLQTPARLLLAVGFAVMAAVTPAVAAGTGPAAHPAVKTTAAPGDNCSSSQRNVSYSLNCSPSQGVSGWNPGNDWTGGLPSESGLTQQNDTRGH